MRLAIAVVAVLCLGATRLQPPRSVWDGVYTTGQAKRGSVQSERCAPCHGFALEGDFAPPLVGPAFARKWDGRTLGDLFDLIELNFAAMNAKDRVADPEKVSGQQSADFLAYLLLQSQFPGGQAELPAAPDVLRRIRLVASRPAQRNDAR